MRRRWKRERERERGGGGGGEGGQYCEALDVDHDIVTSLSTDQTTITDYE